MIATGIHMVVSSVNTLEKLYDHDVVCKTGSAQILGVWSMAVMV